jgi:U3 small nucleolar RNA-associated protein 12
LLLLDIASAAVLEDIPAHESSIWSICLDGSERLLISGSADKHVKLWEVAQQLEEKGGEQRDDLSSNLRHVKTLKLAADVLAVRLSPNGKYLAVALLDSTVKIFYRDTLKFYLSLYGHKVSTNYELQIISLTMSSCLFSLWTSLTIQSCW